MKKRAKGKAKGKSNAKRRHKGAEAAVVRPDPHRDQHRTAAPKLKPAAQAARPQSTRDNVVMLRRREPEQIVMRLPERRARAVAAPYDYTRDDGLAVGMLLLPFLMLALAIGISQPFGSKSRFSDRGTSVIVYPIETRLPVPVPRYAMAPRENTPLPPVAIAVAPVAPSVAAPQVAIAPLVVEVPVAPALTVPATPPVAAEPEIALLPPATPPQTVPERIPEIDSQIIPAPPAAAAPLPETMPVPEIVLPPAVVVPDPSPPVIAAPAPPITVPAEPKVCLAPSAPEEKATPAVAPNRETFGLALTAAAKTQLGDLVVYTDAYRRLSYPMGDVPKQFGVCTDVVVRAYRAVGLDLQALVHQARAGAGDPSIDHRRTEVLRRFFAVKGEKLPISPYAEDYLPGDIVTYYRPQNTGSTSHIVIVSDEIGPSGRPMIIHNRGWGPQIEDALFVDEITGHYRYSGPKARDEIRTASIAPVTAAAKPKFQRLAFKASYAPGRGRTKMRTQSVAPVTRLPGTF